MHMNSGDTVQIEASDFNPDIDDQEMLQTGLETRFIFTIIHG